MRAAVRTAFGASALVTACGVSSTSGAPGVPYLDNATFRRAEMTASLVNPANGYSQLRLAHYEAGGATDWDLLPEWNPRVEPIGEFELDAAGGASGAPSLSPGAAALALPESVATEDDPGLIALGAAAFTRYPVQLAPYMGVALASRAAAAHYGLWVDGALGVGGLVRVELADGSGAIAVTCATCHASPGLGPIEMGLPNARLDVGAALLDSGTFGDAAAASAIAAWGPGRLDVTTSGGTEPVAISDLRPVRWLSHLHHDATLVQRDRTALAIRIETLMITSQSEAVRPPRVVALALAAYVAGLADALPKADAAAQGSPQGASVFESQCVSCHLPPALTGPPVPLDVVGTDPTLGLSLNRGTGMYRVPSLHGVGTRGPLLHDGTVPSLDAMFDPARLTRAFTERLHGEGAVPGHPFGLDLSDGDRSALVAYLRAL
jgi:cytochrome c553